MKPTKSISRRHALGAGAAMLAAPAVISTKAKAAAEPEAEADSGKADEAETSDAAEEEEKPKKRTRAPRKSTAKSVAKSEDKAEDKAEAKDEPPVDTTSEASDTEGGSARSATLAVEPDTPKKEGPRRRGWWSRGK